MHSADDVIIEAVDEGHDLVKSTVSFTLSDYVDDLTLLGSAIAGTGNAQSNVITGNDANNQLDGGGGDDILVGGLGDDVYAVDSSSDVVQELSGQGTDLVVATASYALSANIENLSLAGSDDINGTGNGLANIINGNNANNIIDGGKGADHMAGRNGDDTYYVDNAGDVVIETPDHGHDTVHSSINYSLTDNVEDLYLTGSAKIGNGNALDNALYGDAQNNALDGGEGADIMAGGAGDDLYFVDNIDDQVVENAEGGKDEVRSSVTFTLSANVENLTLLGADAIDGTGNAGANTITGNSADNVLDGGASGLIRGGPFDPFGGHDTLIGWGGNDTYVIHSSQDVIKEQVGQGTDTVAAWASYVLPNNVENIVLQGENGLNATGNGLANMLTGNSGDNVLDGKGGADLMQGGQGDDTYYVDNPGDVVIEGLGEGHDRVIASLSYALSVNVEDLTLTGSANLNGSGNGLDNVLYGNDGANILDGGQGADTFYGGRGNDTYLIDNAADAVFEDEGGGIDTIRSSVSYVLPLNVETLVLVGPDNIDATGNSDANTLVGNGGDNVLDGAAGADLMKGGLGADTYYVDDAGDVVQETGADIDTVHTTLNTYALPTNVEVLIFDGVGAFAGTGNGSANTITGGDGNDVLDGRMGADTLIGGQGDDLYLVDNAGDLITELDGQGHDTVRASADYVLAPSASVEVLQAAAGAAGIDLTGNGLNNEIIGNGGANKLYGGLGDDVISGGAGNDQLFGGAGDDHLAGGAGIDKLTGGAGADTFIFASLADFGASPYDMIADFSHAEGDKIDLSGFDADLTEDGVQHLNFGGARSLVPGHPGELLYVASHGVVTLYGDVNGDGVADFAFKVMTNDVLTAADFIL